MSCLENISTGWKHTTKMENKLIHVDLVIPSVDGYKYISKLFQAIKKQQGVVVDNFVISITRVNKKRDEKLIGFCDANKIKYFVLKRKEFSHSLTREKAIREYCTNKIVILMTQDVKLIDDMAFYNLVRDIDRGISAYNYGKQVGPKNGIEHYIRQKNYRDESFFASKGDIERMHLMAFFASDAFSALDRDVFIKIGGYQGADLTTNEDMFYSYYVLQNGYLKKYCSNAVVLHYHNMSLKKLYYRYKAVGIFFKENKLFEDYKTNHAGFKLAFYILGKAIIHFDILAVLYWPFNMAARFLGEKKGKHGRRK